LAQSSGVTQKFTDAEYDVISGPALVNKVLEEFPHKPELKILDILNCEGGCINGPGMISQEPLEQRRQKVIAHWNKSK
jgi:iron only hydrogenase large subunit-like protein